MNDNFVLKMKDDAFLLPLLDGVLGSTGLFTFYLVLMRLLTGSWELGLEQIDSFQPYITLLLMTFGMFSFVSSFVSRYIHTKYVRVSKSASVVSMVVCCSHHIIDLFPLVGIAFGISALSAYQKEFMTVGILTNIFMTFYFIGKLNTSESSEKYLTRV